MNWPQAFFYSIVAICVTVFLIGFFANVSFFANVNVSDDNDD